MPSLRASQVKPQSVVKPQSLEKPTVTQALPPENSLSWQDLLGEIKAWVDERAKEAGQTAAVSVAIPKASGPAAEVLAKMGEAREIVSDQLSHLAASSESTHPFKPAEKSVTSGPRQSEAKGQGPNHSGLRESQVSKGVRTAVEGQDPVFNNPWSHGVEPVERYLKQHVHDAASIELLEWGQVEATREGYQVRCVYKSKNVLGKMATQSRLFVMDREGRVIDIRD